MIDSDSSTLVQDTVGTIAISWQLMTISLHFSETSSILCSILVKIHSRCQWPLPLCINSYIPFDKTSPSKPLPYTHVSLSHSCEAAKTILLIAFRTILCTGPPSWGMGPLSWRTLMVSSCRSLHEKHEFPVPKPS